MYCKVCSTEYLQKPFQCLTEEHGVCSPECLAALKLSELVNTYERVRREREPFMQDALKEMRSLADITDG